MPEARKQLPLKKAYSLDEFPAIEQGFIPKRMEDKWFIFLENDWLCFHRSWTGYCIYQVRFTADATKYDIAEAWVNRNPTQYSEMNDKNDVELLLKLTEWLIHGGL
jgi:hypothetical protein